MTEPDSTPRPSADGLSAMGPQAQAGPGSEAGLPVEPSAANRPALGRLPEADLVLVPTRWWHIETIARLERTVFVTDAWSAELFWSELAQGDQRYYLTAMAHPRGTATHDLESIVGYAGLAISDDGAYVQTVGVVPAARGRGIGARLMIALLRRARETGARSCGLEVRTDNHTARALYHRLGFVDIGTRRGYYQPSGGDAFVMRARPINTVGYGAFLDGLERDLPGHARLAS
ncbi:(ribosomal protein S18)-alanine N-acetyltransferase [Frankia sp. AiPs1]|uniref:ribosomal protein S18-alanine N-acetyltransferase n=1 Tax=Frankia sp. AiPa1 TaxID=573492 RepID=UPI00202B56AA|nr:ribosomal protein S18-alanine N-acetyltransferase [Frankia sp. AiPa1]MCL9757772.1 ribosomal protein S18-alanine N-acetyltransferase [Frankia sp. AiPa1]